MTASLALTAESAHLQPASRQIPCLLPDITQSTFDYTPTALAGYAAGAAVVAWLFSGIAPTALLLPWTLVLLLMVGFRFWLWRSFAQAALQDDADRDWARWLQRSNFGTLAAAGFWGATGCLFYGHGGGLQQTGLIVIVYTFCVAGIPVLAIQPRMYLGFAALCQLPLAARIASVGDLDHYQLAGELVLIIGLTTLLATSYRQALQRAIELKLKADGLSALLRIEKQAADVARQQAEVANRAKTQFFAAASHDLRQPLHAMGLFAEALRQRDHEPEVARLVNSINESVDALDALFSELLDITRIDSGGVEVRSQHFTVGDIFRRLRLHFEPAAFEKGLSLRLRGGNCVVSADPLLVERILCNLVSNAIRYTDEGSVLVSCRRRGERMRLQVWDTGRGMSAPEQARVFEEFYQVPAAQAAVAAHERKGLGLGLAIVRRLADLLQAPLGLRSRPGHGTVFELELPAGEPHRARAHAEPPRGPAAITLEGRLIVVVEDEPSVRAGLEVLLQGWGARIAAFDSLASSASWATQSAQSGIRPDLLMVDYRLESGKTGVDAIRALRGCFRFEVPAILITGSTMTGHEKDAQQNDFHLLTKPVAPNKLRAMIGFKLGVKSGA